MIVTMVKNRNNEKWNLVSSLISAERGLTMLVSEYQITIGPKNQTAATLPNNLGLYRTVKQEVPKTSREIGGKCEAAS